MFPEDIPQAVLDLNEIEEWANAYCKRQLVTTGRQIHLVLVQRDRRLALFESSE